MQLSRYSQISIVYLLLLTVFAYSNSFIIPFQFDDYPSIVNNLKIRSLNPWEVIQFQSSRFVLMYTFAINYYFAELNTTTYHLLNLFIHLINGILLFYLLKIIVSAIRRKGLIKIDQQADLLIAITVGIFWLHPVQTQAVSYIWQRAAILSTTFYLISLILFLQSVLKNSKKLIFLSVLTALLGMFTKENAVTIPFTCLLVGALIFPKEYLWKRVFPHTCYFLLPVTALILNYYLGFNLQKQHAEINHLQQITHYQFFITQISNLWRYLEILYNPNSLSVIKEIPIKISLDFSVLSGFVLIFGFLILSILFWRRLPLYTLGLLVFLMTISLEAGLIKLADYFFDHRLYLPFIGLALIILQTLMLFREFLTRFKNIKILNILLIFILFFSISCLGLKTFERNKVWQTEISLWEDAASKYPNSLRATTNLANSYARAGEYALAISYYQKLLLIGDSEYATYQLFFCYLKLENIKKRDFYLNQLIQKYPESVFTKHAMQIVIPNNQLNSSDKT